jgi:hypothetical protein
METTTDVIKSILNYFVNNNVVIEQKQNIDALAIYIRSCLGIMLTFCIVIFILISLFRFMCWIIELDIPFRIRRWINVNLR